MGYFTLDFKKAKGASDTRMSDHIERKVIASNVDSTRMHLNRELIKLPEGVKERDEAISHRIKSAGIKRKITPDQVRAIRVMLSGTHEDMMNIQQSGRIGEWCNDSLQWLHKTFGQENVVSAVLHMDETTPHIHATLVPIVIGERRKAKKEKEEGKRTYRKKGDAVRLCADDVLNREKLIAYHDDYAKVMSKYGLQRGVRGSEARHISTAQYYRSLKRENEVLETDVQQLHEQKQEAENKLKQVRSEINTQKMKGAAVNATTAIADSVSSLLGGNKVKRLEVEKEQQKQDIADLKQQVSVVQAEKKKSEIRLCSEMNALDRKYQNEVMQYKDRQEKIDTYFPNVKELMPLAIQCRELGFTVDMTKRLVSFRPVPFRGKLYSAEYKQNFKTDDSTAIIEENPQQKGKFLLYIDGLPLLEWFKMKFQEIKEKLGITPKIENEPKRGLRM